MIGNSAAGMMIVLHTSTVSPADIFLWQYTDRPFSSDDNMYSPGICNIVEYQFQEQVLNKQYLHLIIKNHLSIHSFFLQHPSLVPDNKIK